jgi:hypothetical protein
VYFFEREPEAEQWNLRTRIGGSNDGPVGASVAVNKEGTTAALVALKRFPLNNSHFVSSTGAVLIYNRDGSSWSLTASMAAPRDGWGSLWRATMDDDGRRVMVSSSSPNAYMFENVAGTWKFRQRLTPDISAWFVTSVAMSGDGEVVLLCSVGSGQQEDSHVYEFTRQSNGTFDLTSEVRCPGAQDDVRACGSGLALHKQGRYALIGSAGQNVIHAYERRNKKGLILVDAISPNGTGIDPWYVGAASLSGATNVALFRIKNHKDRSWGLSYRTQPSLPSEVYTPPYATFGSIVGIAATVTAVEIRSQRPGADDPVRISHQAEHPGDNSEESTLLLGVEIVVQPGSRARHPLHARPYGPSPNASV